MIDPPKGAILNFNGVHLLVKKELIKIKN